MRRIEIALISVVVAAFIGGMTQMPARVNAITEAHWTGPDHTAVVAKTQKVTTTLGKEFWNSWVLGTPTHMIAVIDDGIVYLKGPMVARGDGEFLIYRRR